MRTLHVILLSVMLAAGAFAQSEAAKPAPVMPSEITLTSGRVLRKVQVQGWKSDAVLIKSAAGLENVPFAVIKSPGRETLVALRDAAKADDAKNAELRKQIAAVDAQIAATRERTKAAAEESARLLEENCEKASRQGTLMEGQTYDQVRRILGDYQRYNDYASGRERQAIYYQSNGEVYYVYFTDGRMTSWQKSRR